MQSLKAKFYRIKCLKTDNHSTKLNSTVEILKKNAHFIIFTLIFVRKSPNVDHNAHANWNGLICPILPI